MAALSDHYPPMSGMELVAGPLRIVAKATWEGVELGEWLIKAANRIGSEG